MTTGGMNMWFITLCSELRNRILGKQNIARRVKVYQEHSG